MRKQTIKSAHFISYTVEILLVDLDLVEIARNSSRSVFDWYKKQTSR